MKSVSFIIIFGCRKNRLCLDVCYYVNALVDGSRRRIPWYFPWLSRTKHIFILLVLLNLKKFSRFIRKPLENRTCVLDSANVVEPKMFYSSVKVRWIKYTFGVWIFPLWSYCNLENYDDVWRVFGERKVYTLCRIRQTLFFRFIRHYFFSIN